MPENTENQPVQPKEPTQVEKEAMLQGWKPKEEFQGEEEKFIDAGEFLRNGKLFSKIDAQNRELKSVKKSFELLVEHHKNVEKAAYDRAIVDLKRQRKEALANGDVETFNDLEDKLEETKEARDNFVQNLKVQQSVQEQQPIAPEFQNWVNRNPWYVKDTLLQGAADRLGVQLAEKGYSPEQVLELVEEKIKKEFPNKFTNPNRTKAGAVEAPATRGGNTKSGFVPTAEQRQVAKVLVRSGAFKTEKEYFAECEKMEKGN